MPPRERARVLLKAGKGRTLEALLHGTVLSVEWITSVERIRGGAGSVVEHEVTLQPEIRQRFRAKRGLGHAKAGV